MRKQRSQKRGATGATTNKPKNRSEQSHKRTATGGHKSPQPEFEKGQLPEATKVEEWTSATPAVVGEIVGFRADFNLGKNGTLRLKWGSYSRFLFFYADLYLGTRHVSYVFFFSCHQGTMRTGLIKYFLQFCGQY
ncbi:hypothetical protein Adt_05313 [Abeliophyllum distichum]|uniref:Uncharacterized protein n=1 Tax=Abeliophyllum distichum TaxID=126358 RepID=A0ABD1V3R8_9LAMI